MLARWDPRWHAAILAAACPVEISAQAPRDRAERGRRRVHHAVVERPEPGVRLRLESGCRASAADQVPDLVQRDEVGDLAANRRDRDLELPAPPADRSPPRRSSDQLDAVLAAEILDVGLHQIHARRLGGFLSCLNTARSLATAT